MKETLEAEKAELERQIKVNQEQSQTALTAVYWLKKRVKLVESQMKEMPENEGIR
jgi:hypothetical protein